MINRDFAPGSLVWFIDHGGTINSGRVCESNREAFAVTCGERLLIVLKSDAFPTQVDAIHHQLKVETRELQARQAAVASLTKRLVAFTTKEGA